MGRLSTADNSCGKEIAMLDISLKAMTSAAMAVRAMRRDLYVWYNLGAELSKL